MPSSNPNRSVDSLGGAPAAQLLVVGGGAGIGMWLVREVLQHERNLRITLADVDDRVHDVAKALQGSDPIAAATISYPADGGVEGVGSLARFDIVMLAVPLSEMHFVAARICPELRDGTLVFDVSSEKEAPVRSMLAAAEGRLSIIGTHPLFGLAVGRLVGQTVVICPTAGARRAHVAWLTTVLRKHGAVITFATPDEHDRYMAYVQALTHLVYFSFAKALQQERVSVDRAWDFQTPPYRFLVAFAGRLLSGNAQLYANIQHALARPEARRAFASAAAELARISETPDTGELVRELESLTRTFPASDLAYCDLISRSTVEADQQADRTLHACRQHRRLCGIRYGRKQSVTAGIVEGLTRTEIVLHECRAPSSGDGPYGLTHTPDAAKAAHLLGFGTPVGRRITIHRRTATVLTEGELDEWIVQNLRHHRRAVTLAVGREVSLTRLAGCVVMAVPELLEAKAIDVYDPPSSLHQRVTFELVIRGDSLPEPVVEETCRVARDLGAGPR